MKKLNQVDFIRFFENTYSWLILIVIFSFYYLGYVPNPNEENYLLFAKEFMDPDWIKNSFFLKKSAGTRVLSEYIVGFFLKYFSFEAVVLIFRGFFIIAYSFILDRIYKSLKINNIMIVAHLVLIYLHQQSYFGGSWIFIRVEAKAFAYMFILLALYNIIQKKYNLTVLFLIIATYFHILVGGYGFIYFGLSILILEKFNFQTNYKLVLKLFIYVLAVSPFIFFLLKNTHSPTDLKPDADWIYAYFRNPQHTTLTDSTWAHLIGIIQSFIALLTLLYFRKKDNIDPRMEVLYVIGIVSFAGTLILLPFVFFDKNGTILKFYLFRINAVSTFIFSLVLTKWIFSIIKTEYKTIIYVVITFFATKTLLIEAKSNYKIHRAYNNDPIIEVSDYIKSNTKEDAVVLGLFETTQNLSLTRRMERDPFVVYKFFPPDFNKVHEWYYRLGIKEDLLKDIDNLNFAAKKYKIDFIISEIKLKKDFLELKYNDDSYFLYKNLLQKK